MEIQSQSVIVNGTPGASGSTGSSASNGTQAQAPFALTLNGMMSGNQGQGGSANTTIQSIPASVQLLNPLLLSFQAGDAQSLDVSGEQVGALAELLQQPEQGDALLTNPDLQAWLLQLQSLVAAMMQNQQPNEGESQGTETFPSEEAYAEGTASIADQLLFVPAITALQENEETTTEKSAGAGQANVDSSEGDQIEAAADDAAENIHVDVLDPLLFIPIAVDTSAKSDSSEASDDNKQPVLTSGQAVELLNQLKDWIKAGQNDAEVKQVLRELPAVLASAATAANMTLLHKSSTTASPVLLAASQAKAAAVDDNTVSLTDLVQIASNKPRPLEMLATKHVQIMNRLELNPDEDRPLFEPLSGNEVDEPTAQPITVQEFMRQTQAGHRVKMPVLHMPASTFTDDMTQFVVSSFMMESSVDGFTEAKISLYPQHLGHVDVKLTMHNGQLVAQFVADSLVGKEMLENQLSQLRTALQSQGIQVEKLEVSQSQGFQSGMFQDGRQQQQPGQSAKQQKSSGSRTGALDEVSMEETNDATTAVRTAGSGSIDITA